MTCIVGIRSKGLVVMGADSAVSNNSHTEPRLDPKLFEMKVPFYENIESRKLFYEKMIIGSTGSVRMSQILQTSIGFPPEEIKQDFDPYKWMITSFIEEVRSKLKEYGYSTIQNNEESGGTFMVGFYGRLYVVYSDYQVGESARSFAAIGSGDQYALGSLYTTESMDMPHERRLLLALKASEQNPFVSPPYTFTSIQKGKQK